jgi:MFS family permease
MANTGLAIGSLIGGIITPKLGLKRTIIISNILGLFANFLKQILSTETIISGRLLFGIACGISTFCYVKTLNDTIPSEVMYLYGGLVNGCFTFGIFASNFLGMIIPLDNE